MNPFQFNSKIYGYSTSETVKKPSMGEQEMKQIVNKVLHQMNTEKKEVPFYDTLTTYPSTVPPSFKTTKNQSNKNNLESEFSPEFYNTLKSMISKEVKKQNEHKKGKVMDNNLLKKLNYYEKRINLLEEQILLLKNNFL